MDMPQKNVRSIYGYHDPLSNHYSANIHVFGQTFESAEQAYRHTQAINAKRPDLAEDIMKAPNAGEVKRIAKNIPFNPAWLQRKEEVMRDILMAKKEQVETSGLPSKTQKRTS